MRAYAGPRARSRTVRRLDLDLHSERMRARAGFLAVFLVAVLAAALGAASGSSGSTVAANRGVQSFALGVALPVILVVAIGTLVVMAATLFRHGEPGEEHLPPRGPRWLRVLVVLVAFALFGLLGYLIYANRTAHRVRPLSAGRPGRSVLRHVAAHPVPINHSAFVGTSVVIGLLILLIAWRRFGWALSMRGRSASLLGPVATEVTPGAPQRAERLPAAVSPPLADPADEADPRRAIMLAYARFSALMSDLGSGRLEAETPFEFSRRLVADPRRAPADNRAEVRRLTALFAAARYSREPLSSLDRSDAIKSLRTIEARLEPST